MSALENAISQRLSEMNTANMSRVVMQTVLLGAKEEDVTKAQMSVLTRSAGELPSLTVQHADGLEPPSTTPSGDPSKSHDR